MWRRKDRNPTAPTEPKRDFPTSQVRCGNIYACIMAARGNYVRRQYLWGAAAALSACRRLDTARRAASGTLPSPPTSPAHDVFDRTRNGSVAAVWPSSKLQQNNNLAHRCKISTRQLSYRKEDRAMRPIYGCPQKLWESSLRTRVLFRKFVMDICSDRY